MSKLHTVGLLAIRKRKLLLAFSNNKQCFYLPGGKVDAGETSMQALCREVAEEMNTMIEEKDLTYYTHVSAPAFGEIPGLIMEQDCYLLNHAIEPKAAGEIGALRYFSLSDYLLESSQAPGAVMILQQLQINGLID